MWLFVSYTAPWCIWRSGGYTEWVRWSLTQHQTRWPGTTWAQLFKANDIVSQQFVKIYIEWYADMLKFFAEKMWVAFAVQKLLTFFSAKNIRILCIKSAKIFNKMTLNEFVKLTRLWTTGPCLLWNSQIDWIVKTMVFFDVSSIIRSWGWLHTQLVRLFSSRQ